MLVVRFEVVLLGVDTEGNEFFRGKEVGVEADLGFLAVVEHLFFKGGAAKHLEELKEFLE